MSSLGFFLSEEIFILLLFLKDNFTGHFYQHFKDAFHCLPTCSISSKKSAISLIIMSLQVRHLSCFFFLDALEIFLFITGFYQHYNMSSCGFLCVFAALIFPSGIPTVRLQTGWYYTIGYWCSIHHFSVFFPSMHQLELILTTFQVYCFFLLLCQIHCLYNVLQFWYFNFCFQNGHLVIF